VVQQSRKSEKGDDFQKKIIATPIAQYTKIS
jgi:hypothetical protein